MVKTRRNSKKEFFRGKKMMSKTGRQNLVMDLYHRRKSEMGGRKTSKGVQSATAKDLNLRRTQNDKRKTQVRGRGMNQYVWYEGDWQ